MCKCNMCEFVQETPVRYLSPSHDSSDSELSHASFEFPWSFGNFSKYCKVLSNFFLIDISITSWKAGIPYYALSALKEIIRSLYLNRGRQFLFGIAFFDTKIHFVKIKGHQLSLLSMDTFVDPGHAVPAVKLLGMPSEKHRGSKVK
jgi:hypothetical protein